jgi:peptidyl-prolyl cis-trans isomerase A (cyclophilin A)
VKRWPGVSLASVLEVISTSFAALIGSISSLPSMATQWCAVCRQPRVADWHPVTSPIQTATATLHTNRGDIKIALFGNHAPKTVANFVGLAQGTKDYSTENATGGPSGPFYDGAIFHRVIDGFMIQGGDPTGTGRGGPGYQFEDEFHPELQFSRPYLLAMANAGPGTNGSQFFITVGQTPHLNRKHTIFGEVVDPESQRVVDAIASTAVDRSDRPTDPVVIDSITIS